MKTPGTQSVARQPEAAGKKRAINAVAAGAPPENKASPGEPPSPKGSAFRDSPLAKEEALQIALTLGLLVCAGLIVTLFLAHDIYQSFGKWPPVSNVTAVASSSESTSELPTPFFMR